MPDQKPMMQLDSMLRKTHRVPIHPETGKVWTEKMDELAEAQLDESEDAPARRARLLEGVQMREQPYVCEFHFFAGAAAAKGSAISDQKHYGCHPDTWRTMTDEQRAHFEPLDVDAWRTNFKCESSTLSPTNHPCTSPPSPAPSPSPDSSFQPPDTSSKTTTSAP